MNRRDISLYVDGFVMMFRPGTTLYTTELRQAVAEAMTRMPHLTHVAVLGHRVQRPSGATVLEVDAMRLGSDETISQTWLDWNHHEVRFMADVLDIDAPYRLVFVSTSQNGCAHDHECAA